MVCTPFTTWRQPSQVETEAVVSQCADTGSTTEKQSAWGVEGFKAVCCCVITHTCMVSHKLLWCNGLLPSQGSGDTSDFIRSVQQLSSCLSPHIFTVGDPDSEEEVDFSFSEDTRETTPPLQSPAHTHTARRRGRSGVVNCTPAHSLPHSSPNLVGLEAPPTDSERGLPRNGRSGVVNCTPSPVTAGRHANRPTASAHMRSGVVNCRGAEMAANLPGASTHTRHVSLAHSDLHTAAAAKRSSDHRPKISLPPLFSPAPLQLSSSTQLERTGEDGGMVGGETGEEHLGGSGALDSPVSPLLGEWGTVIQWLSEMVGPTHSLELSCTPLSYCTLGLAPSQQGALAP